MVIKGKPPCFLEKANLGEIKKRLVPNQEFCWICCDKNPQWWGRPSKKKHNIVALWKITSGVEGKFDIPPVKTMKSLVSVWYILERCDFQIPSTTGSRTLWKTQMHPAKVSGEDEWKFRSESGFPSIVTHQIQPIQLIHPIRAVGEDGSEKNWP